MYSVISSFLRTEITFIPHILRKIIGNYDNALTNGTTWMFFIWTLIHYSFEKVVDSLLLRMHYKEYIRIRLTDALWSLGFYASAFWYCTATIYKNNLDLFDQKNTISLEYDVVTSNLIMGFVFLISYTLHSFARDAVRHGFGLLTYSDLSLTIFLFTTYITKKLELSFVLFAIISFMHTGLEIVRCVVALLVRNVKTNVVLMNTLCIVSGFLVLLSHGFTIPVVLIIPLVHELYLNYKSLDLWVLNLTILIWISFEIFNNVVYKLIRHIVLHKKFEKPESCVGSTLDCMLFLQRDDLAYHIKLVRDEIEERRQCQMGLRKPKNRSMLIQTLKSVAMLSMISENVDNPESLKDKSTVEIIKDGMVAIRKKLHQKRMAESSDSDSDSENVLTGVPMTEVDDTDKDDTDQEDESEEIDSTEGDGLLEQDVEELEESLEADLRTFRSTFDSSKKPQDENLEGLVANCKELHQKQMAETSDSDSESEHVSTGVPMSEVDDTDQDDTHQEDESEEIDSTEGDGLLQHDIEVERLEADLRASLSSFDIFGETQKKNQGE